MSNPWEIATWRFEMISALLDANRTRAQKRRIIRDRTKLAVQWPYSPEPRPIGKSTLFRWLKNYREKGFLGLMPKARKDKGLARSDRSIQVNYALGVHQPLDPEQRPSCTSGLSGNFATPKGHGQKTA